MLLVDESFSGLMLLVDESCSGLMLLVDECCSGLMLLVDESCSGLMLLVDECCSGLCSWLMSGLCCLLKVAAVGIAQVLYLDFPTRSNERTKG